LKLTHNKANAADGFGIDVSLHRLQNVIARINRLLVRHSKTFSELTWFF
jgi:hypothetical protein